MVHTLPKPCETFSALTPPPWTAKNPQGPSKASGSAVNPRAASSAAVTPLSAARPTCNGLVIVPKLQRIPAAKLAAMPNPLRSLSPLKPRSFAAAAQAPKGPTVPLEGIPLTQCCGSIHSEILHSTSNPVRKESIKVLPSTPPNFWLITNALVNGGIVGWVSRP